MNVDANDDDDITANNNNHHDSAFVTRHKSVGLSDR